MTSAKRSAAPVAPGASLPAANSADEAFKIGLITPLTGTLAGYGAGQRIAAQLAVKDVNNSGGINGSSLSLVLLDDAGNPGEDAALLRRLATQDKVIAVMGPLTSPGFQVAAPLASELQVPLVAVGATGRGVPDLGRPWTFRFGLLDAAATPKAVAAFKKLYPDVKRMVVAGDIKEPASSYLVRTVFPGALKEAGLEVIDTAYFDTGTTDFSALVAKIRSLNPQGVALSALTPEAVALARELQRQRVRAPVVASLQNWGGPELGLAREAMEGWLAAGAFDEDTSDPRGKAYVERFNKASEGDPAFGGLTRPGPWAPTYDAVTALAQVMQTAQVTWNTDLLRAREAIRGSLQSLKGFRGITGDTSILATGEITVLPLAFVAKGGRWVLLGQP